MDSKIGNSEGGNEKACMDQLELLCKNTSITADTITEIVISLMKFVETLPKLNGQQKKNLVVSCLNVYMDTKGYDKSVLNGVSSFIDIAISIEKGTITIGKKEIENVVSCCSFLCQKKKK